ncbi:MAG: ABC transporter C-terminal domain-containing protein [Planctomycetota bacterium]
MNNNPPNLFVVFGLVAVAFACPIPATSQNVDELEQRIDQLEAALAERDATIAKLESQLAALQGRTEELDAREAQLEIMAGAVTTGEYAERFDSLVTVKQRDGRTIVSAGPLVFEDEPLVGDLFLSAVYSLPGDSAVGQPESVTLFIQGKFTGDQLADVEHVTFEGVDETFDLAVADYDRVSKRSGLVGKRSGNKSDETVSMVVDVPTMRRLAESPSLSMRTPKGVVTWQREQRALLRALLTRMELPTNR